MEGFGIDWKILIGQIINFVILLYLLKRFVYKPFLSLLEQRRSKIEDGIKKSDEVEKRIEEVKLSREKILANAQTEAANVVKAGEARSRDVADKIIFEAKNEKDKIIQEGVAEAEKEKRDAEARTRGEIVKAGLMLTEEILKEKLDTEKDKSLIERFLVKFQHKYDKSS